MIDGDPEETPGRRKELARYAVRSLAPFIFFNDLRSALEEIEKRSQALLAKGAQSRSIDEGEDSEQVTRLVERLREAISHYQVRGHWTNMLGAVDMEGQISQQQAIYDKIVNLTVRTLLLFSVC